MDGMWSLVWEFSKGPPKFLITSSDSFIGWHHSRPLWPLTSAHSGTTASQLQPATSTMSGRQLTELETVENWAAGMMVDFRVSEGVSFLSFCFVLLSFNFSRLPNHFSRAGSSQGLVFFFISFPLKASLNFL